MAKEKLDPTQIRQVQEWLLQGHIVVDILRNITTKLNLSEKEGLELIAAAFEDFTKQTSKDYPETKAFHVQLRLNLYKKAMEDKEYKIALQVLQDLAKLEDL